MMTLQRMMSRREMMMVRKMTKIETCAGFAIFSPSWLWLRRDCFLVGSRIEPPPLPPPPTLNSTTMALVVPDKNAFQHILRLLNTNVDGKEKVMFALTRIKGVG